MREPSSYLSYLLPFFLWVCLLVGLYLASLYSYLLFHGIAEISSVIIAGGVFALAWNSRRVIANNYLLFLGIALLFIAFLDLLHTLAYKGMGPFPGYGADLPTQLWIAARYLQSFTFLAAPLFLHRRLKPGLVFLGYFLVTSLLLLGIFYWHIFPACFVEGQGLTTFKKISEYLICLILLAALAFLLTKRRDFDAGVLRLLGASILLTIGSELAFTFYVSVYGFPNLLGHLFKIMAFYCIYKAILETGLTQPFSLLFRNLKLREEALHQEKETIKELNAELVQRVRQLEATNRELEAFSYSASHDLQAPLRAIISFSQFFREDYGDNLDAEGRRLLTVIQDSAEKMKLLIYSLLDLARMERQEINLTEVNMEELVLSVFAEQTATASKVPEFIIKPLPPARGDPVMLRQVWANLLANACKFSQNRETPIIEVGSRNELQGNVYYVRDNGIGFDMQYAEQVFESFTRLHSSEEFEGTGIGLALVSRIIDRHGGRVWAEGKLEEGATFYFSLPR